MIYVILIPNVKTPINQMLMYPISQILWFLASSSTLVSRSMEVLWCSEQLTMWGVCAHLGSSSSDARTRHTARPKLSSVVEF